MILEHKRQVTKLYKTFCTISHEGGLSEFHGFFISVNSLNFEPALPFPLLVEKKSVLTLETSAKQVLALKTELTSLERRKRECFFIYRSGIILSTNKVS